MDMLVQEFHYAKDYAEHLEQIRELEAEIASQNDVYRKLDTAVFKPLPPYTLFPKKQSHI